MLTKDNLIKHTWQGNITCCFCHEDKTIQHLFIDCRFARSVWSVAHIALNLAKPQSIWHMFGSWLYGVKKELRSLVLLGAGVIAWSIWLHRNGIVFKKKKIVSPVQVVYLATHWLRTWAILQKPIKKVFSCKLRLLRSFPCG